ncbi:hypothetical protein [Methylobacterium oxalidis]|uniref:Uncharacterized protein n=1 Tax=Methylobacterium oxalidis TaxID=944322 RepID=A0A512J185_9HYPH|nr:hypothetical protein [Methylobacterium oxalidis]GEP03695.1 hypothetical protein MOX02_17330 [Methylobacterium oxalidis]GJE33699.1 hypothetical protein LDDCCGHA_3902 [Methylobacterium oxalidis]GLS62279.1 hypothetical protein GCM10007888_06600 [Methylobacterium oxalidis]
MSGAIGGSSGLGSGGFTSGPLSGSTPGAALGGGSGLSRRGILSGGLNPRIGRGAGSGTGSGSGADVPIVTDGKTIVGLGEAGTAQYANILGKRESGNRYGIRNSYGFSGRWQMGAAALFDTGYVNTKRNRELNNPGIWTEKARAMGVGNMADFLANRNGVQDKQFIEYTSRNLRALQRMGVIRPGMQANELAGWLAAAHLKGPGGAAALARGRDNFDANGTSASSYRRMMSGVTGGAGPSIPTPGADLAKAEALRSSGWTKGLGGNAAAGFKPGFGGNAPLGAETPIRPQNTQPIGGGAGAGASSSTHSVSAPITINGAGQDPQAIANAVQRKLQEAMNRRTHDISPSFA